MSTRDVLQLIAPVDDDPIDAGDDDFNYGDTDGDVDHHFGGEAEAEVEEKERGGF